MAEYNIWTDGGYNISRGVGACAYVVLEGEQEISRYAEKMERSTNNRCELMAIYLALKSLPVDSGVVVHTDSRYCIGVLSGDYRRNKNLDILEMYDSMVKDKGLDVRFRWVKGHSGDRYNELCDSLCQQAAECELDYFLKSSKGKSRKVKKVCYFCGAMSNEEFVINVVSLSRKYGDRVVNFVRRLLGFDYSFDKDEIKVEWEFLRGMNNDVDDLLSIVREDTDEYIALTEHKALLEGRLTQLLKDLNIV